jgi:hypothetical protein
MGQPTNYAAPTGLNTLSHLFYKDVAPTELAQIGRGWLHFLIVQHEGRMMLFGMR